MINRRRWSKQDLKLLKQNINKSGQELEKLLGRSSDSIYKKRHQIINNIQTSNQIPDDNFSKIIKSDSKRWTDKDIDYLKNNYAITDTTILANKLNKTISSLHSQASKLKLKKININSQILTQQFLKKEYCLLKKSPKTIAEETGITENIIYFNIRKFNLPANNISDYQTKIGPDHHYWKGFGKISGHYWGKVVKGANKRNLEISITIEDAWNKFLEQDCKCIISGVNLYFPKSITKEKSSSQTASLDRIDSFQGYVSNNIQWIHKDINIMKNKMSNKKLISWCKIIAEYNL